MNQPARTRIKICGVRDFAIAEVAIESGADALGFVFHAASPRFIEPPAAWGIVSRLPPFVTTVALTVDLTFEDFQEIEQVCPTDYTQLHGNESVEIARACGPRIIKAIQFDEGAFDRVLAQWSAIDEVDAILIDGSSGGMGRTFEWSALGDRIAQCGKPIILAGGLTPENVAQAVAEVRPFAVDVSSGVEGTRGVKDPARVRAFCEAVRSTDLR